MSPGDDELRVHIARALARYVKQETTNGRHVPRDLVDIAAYLVDSMRQDATKLGDERRTAQAERMADELLTKRQTAIQLGLSVRTLERLIADGELPIVRSGRSVRIRRADLTAYIARRRGSFRERTETKGGAA